MPRNVRNFWVEVSVDGKQEKVATGPRNKEGGIYITVLMRENGDISDKKLIIEGSVTSAGELVLLVDGPDNHVLKIKTKR
jgi:hypothetical protein